MAARARSRWTWGVGLAASAAVHAVPLLASLHPAPARGPVEITVLGDAPSSPAPPPPAEPGRARAGAGMAVAPRARRPPRRPPPPHLEPLGPEGARWTVFIDLQRLKDGPFAAQARSLIMRIPAMSDLLRGTELDLFDAFDALVIAADDQRAAPTFLAARHHLAEDDLRIALDRGAAAAGERLIWSQGPDGGEAPYAERIEDTADAGAGAGVGDGGAGVASEPVFRLAAPGLVVVAPPATVFDGPSLLQRMDAGDAALARGGVALASHDGATKALSADELEAFWSTFEP